MAKKDKRNRLQQSQQQQQLKPKAAGIGFGGISKRGWMVVGAGVGIVSMGFWLLTFTDPAGRNWASSVSPFVILGGYATIGVGIMIPSKQPGTEATKQ